MLMTLNGILIVAKSFVTAPEVAECATFLEVVVLWVRQGGRVLEGGQLLLEVTWNDVIKFWSKEIDSEW